jgi:hypothetical protein
MPYRARHRSLTCGAPAAKLFQENRETVHVRTVIGEQQKKAQRSKDDSSEPVLRLCGIWAGTRPKSFLAAGCFHTQFFTIKYGRLVESGRRGRISFSGYWTRPSGFRSSHGYSGNFLLTTGNAKPFKIADLTNPIHQPGRGENEKDQ